MKLDTRGRISRNHTGSNHLILPQQSLFNLSTQLRLYRTQFLLAKVAMILGDLLYEFFRSLSGVGDCHDCFGTDEDVACGLLNLKTVDNASKYMLWEYTEIGLGNSRKWL